MCCEQGIPLTFARVDGAGRSCAARTTALLSLFNYTNGVKCFGGKEGTELALPNSLSLVCEEISDAGTAAIEPAGGHEPENDAESVREKINDIAAKQV
jgi:hypothetical protein